MKTQRRRGRERNVIWGGERRVGRAIAPREGRRSGEGGGPRDHSRERK